MGPRTSTLLTQILLVAVGVGAYHVATSRKEGVSPEPAPAAPPAATPPRPSALPPVAASPGFVRFEALERRVGSLERALANAGALAPGVAPAAPGGSEGTPGPRGVAPVWTEDQLVAFRAMLAEVGVRKEQEQYAATMRGVLASASKEPIPKDLSERAIDLLVAFQRKIRELFPDGMGGVTEEQRRATEANAQRAREALDEEIRRLLPAEAADRVMSMVPSFPSRLPADNVARPR